MDKVFSIDIFFNTPDAPAFKRLDNILTYQQLKNEVYKRAINLKNLHLPGNIVALAFSGPQEQLLHIYALWAIGKIPFPLSFCAKSEEWQESIEDLELELVLTDQKKENIVCLDSRETINPIRLDFTPATLELNQMALILQTSGSTGTPKKVAYSFDNLLQSANMVNTFFSFQSVKTWGLALPLNHIGGLMVAIRSLLSQGCVVFYQDLNDDLLIQKSNFISLVPTQLSKLLLLPNHDLIESLRSFEAIILGGGQTPPSLINKIVDFNLTAYVTYGMSEMSSMVATSKKIGKTKKASLRFLEGIEYKRNKNKLKIKGPNLFMGYLIKNKLVNSLDEDGFFSPHDQVKWSSNKESFEIIGRDDLIFISGGENVSIAEVENKILELDGIEQALVVAVNDSYYGQVGAAFISSEKAYSLETLKSKLKNNLSPFKIPKYLFDLSQIQGIGFKPSRKKLEDWAKKRVKTP